jgi:hypothetical protein
VSKHAGSLLFLTARNGWHVLASAPCAFFPAVPLACTRVHTTPPARAVCQGRAGRQRPRKGRLCRAVHQLDCTRKCNTACAAYEARRKPPVALQRGPPRLADLAGGVVLCIALALGGHKVRKRLRVLQQALLHRRKRLHAVRALRTHPPSARSGPQARPSAAAGARAFSSAVLRMKQPKAATNDLPHGPSFRSATHGQDSASSTARSNSCSPARALAALGAGAQTHKQLTSRHAGTPLLSLQGAAPLLPLRTRRQRVTCRTYCMRCTLQTDPLRSSTVHCAAALATHAAPAASASICPALLGSGYWRSACKSSRKVGRSVHPQRVRSRFVGDLECETGHT